MNKKILILLIFLFLATRIFLLFTFKKNINGDEAIVGVMALHISEGREFPITVYRNVYDVFV